MEYHNPQPPEGINVSQTHPLLDFLRLLGGLLVIAAIVFTALALLADKLAKYIPFERELEISSRFAAVRSLLDDYTQTTPERIQALARKYLDPQKGWRLAIVPQAAIASGGPPAR